MTIEDQANVVVESLDGLTVFEKNLARNRLMKFYDGRMPLWDKQFAKTGDVSCGYLLVAYVWGTFAGPFLVFATTLAIIHNKSGILIATEILLYCVSLLLFSIGWIRWRRAIRVGKQYRGHQML